MFTLYNCPIMNHNLLFIFIHANNNESQNIDQSSKRHNNKCNNPTILSSKKFSLVQVDGNRKRNQDNHAEQCWSLLKLDKSSLKYTQCKHQFCIYKVNFKFLYNNLPDNNEGRDSLHIYAPNKEDQIDLEKQTSIQHMPLKNCQEIKSIK